MKIRAACLAAVAGLASTGSLAMADNVVFDYRNTTGYFVSSATFSTVMGQALTIASPAPDPISITGIDIVLGNNTSNAGTGTTIPATANLRITVFVWDQENPSTVATDMAYLGLVATPTVPLRTTQFTTGALGFAWPPFTSITFNGPNAVTPGLQFVTPVTDLTDTEMCFSVKLEVDMLNDGNWQVIPGIGFVVRGNGDPAANPGTASILRPNLGPQYYYRNASGLLDGTHLVSDARNIGLNSGIGITVYNTSSAAVPLSAVPGSNPGNPQFSCDGTAVSLLVNVTPGTQPDSTGISVIADTTSMGGGPGTALLDDGASGDGAAGDNLFGKNLILAAGPEAVLAVPYVVSDAEARTASGTINVNRDAFPDLPVNIKGSGPGTPSISGTRTFNDVDMLAICVSDPNNFGASSVAGTTWDSQLFLFDSNGFGVAHNDDDPNDLTGATPQANITGFALPTGGLYYLAISGYNTDPADVGNADIWNNAGPVGEFNTVRAPDGGGANNPIDKWIGLGNAGGVYTIALTGATAVCTADLANGLGANKPDCAVDINDLLFFLGGFEAGDLSVDLTNSGFGLPDCAVDVNDLLFFLQHFETGC